MNTVTCKLMGGLGNQLFQICTTIAFALKTHKPFYFLDIEELDGGKRHTYWNTFLSNLKFCLKKVLDPVPCVWR